MDWSLYFHIPFCRFACHYCDFVKTSRFDAELVQSYFRKLESDLANWLQHLQIRNRTVKSVFFGGGTPGLFTREYENLFERIKPLLMDNAEVSLEVNPNDVSDESLAHWKFLGFNRVSLGIQTMDPLGLQVLTRDHRALTAAHAISKTRSQFENCSLDFIYGWPGQMENSWRADLDFVREFDIPHVSLYNLTFENSTPMGRAKNAGKIVPTAPEDEYHRYAFASEYLSQIGLQQEEISNWSKPHASCEHNHRYWRGDYYLGIGVGAHGFLPDENKPYGMRYSYGKKIPQYLQNPFDDFIVDERDDESWLTEYISCRLRTTAGLDLEILQKKFGAKIDFSNPVLKSGLDEGLLVLQNGVLFLTPLELFREQAWTLQILQNAKK